MSAARDLDVELEREREVAALCDLIIPGDDVYPAPSAIGLPSRLAGHERFAPTADAVLGLLPEPISKLPREAAISALRAVEAAHPLVFGWLIIAVYSLYYSDPAVLPAIEQDFDYAARPPQPLGHSMEPFDPASVVVPASRGPQYRIVGGAADAGG